MTHYWRIRRWLPDRYGQHCRLIVTRSTNGNVMVEFEDGYRVVTSRWSIRRIKQEIDTMPWKAPRNKPLGQAKQQPRQTACKRGYDRKHRNMREQELADHPLCVYCLARGKVVAADTIDHIKAMARGGEALAPENRQPLCGDCNAVKAATIDKGLPNNNADFGPLPPSHMGTAPYDDGVI